MQKQCEYINPETTERCNGFALESGLCFSHDPSKAEEKQQAVVKGGQALKKVKLNLPVVSIKTIEDVVMVLEETINAVRSGDIPTSNPANTIGFLCGHILKALELNQVDTKLDAIDRIILEHRVSERSRK